LISPLNETSVKFSEFCIAPQPLSSVTSNDDFLSDFTTTSIPTTFDAFHSDPNVCAPSGSSIGGFGDFSFAPMTIKDNSGFPVAHNSIPLFNDFQISTPSTSNSLHHHPQSNVITTATPVPFTTTVFPHATFGINGDNTIITSTIPLLPINNNNNNTSTINYSSSPSTFPPNSSLSHTMYFATHPTGNAISTNIPPLLCTSSIMMKPPPPVDYSFSLSQQTTANKSDVFDFVGSALCAELISSTGSNNSNNNYHANKNCATLPLSLVNNTTTGTTCTGNNNTVNNVGSFMVNGNNGSGYIPANGYHQNSMQNIPAAPAMLRNNGDLLPPPSMLYANNSPNNSSSYLAQRWW